MRKDTCAVERLPSDAAFGVLLVDLTGARREADAIAQALQHGKATREHLKQRSTHLLMSPADRRMLAELLGWLTAKLRILEAEM